MRRNTPNDFDPYDHLMTVSTVLNDNIQAMNRLSRMIRDQNSIIKDLEERVNKMEVLALLNEHLDNLEKHNSAG
jgi:hypothetical protein